MMLVITTIVLLSLPDDSTGSAVLDEDGHDVSNANIRIHVPVDERSLLGVDELWECLDALTLPVTRSRVIGWGSDGVAGSTYRQHF